jgi:mannose-6-phosphate isomerase-like protein (cupin superfamily)
MFDFEQEHDEFFTFGSYHGLVCADGDGTTVYGYSPDRAPGTGPYVRHVPLGGGCYGVVLAGTAWVTRYDQEMRVPAGWWFSTGDGFTVELSANAHVVVIQKQGHHGLDGIGRIEATGRLRYIDGCRDTVLQSPFKKGEACLNALYLPAGVHQTMHTHPSTRIGVIFDGEAYCEVGTGAQHVMRPGVIFWLPKNGRHKFRSDLNGSPGLKLVAYHPDSDHGPSDEEHPMLNRTIVGGVSAADPSLAAIRTQ